MPAHAPHLSPALKLLAGLALGWALSGCNSAGAERADDPAAAAVAAALTDAGRTDPDRQRDMTSKPAQVLAFAGIRQGMHVLDLFAGGGYYSELLGYAVGPAGRVYLHNNAAYLQFAGKPLQARMDSGRLRNVQRLDAELGELGIPPQSLDRILMVMTYHDLYYTTEGWAIDPEAFFLEIRRYLKPDGELVIIDHVARPGSGNAAAQTLHRIDPEFARTDISGRGFELIEQSGLLRNSEDDHDLSVFDLKVRGRTDRFIQRYRLAATVD